MGKKSVEIIIFVFFIIIVANGKQNNIYQSCEKQFSKAIEDYNRGWYGRAKSRLINAKMNCAGTSLMDSLSYYLGMSYLKTKAYNSAKLEFDGIKSDFPSSKFIEAAYYYSAYCMYKLSPSHDRNPSKIREAINELKEFKSMFPDSKLCDSADIYINKCYEKLARKEYETAIFYERIDKIESAVIYYKLFIKDYPNSQFVPKALVSLIKHLYNLQRKEEAKKYLEILERYNTDPDIKDYYKFWSYKLNES